MKPDRELRQEARLAAHEVRGPVGEQRLPCGGSREQGRDGCQQLPWRVQRRLLRTFSRMRECEGQKESFVGFHAGQVENHGLVTASGASPVVEVESIECFTIREDLYGQ